MHRLRDTRDDDKAENEDDPAENGSLDSSRYEMFPHDWPPWASQ